MRAIQRVGLEENKAIRFLGLFIDPDLKYNFHCKKIRGKITSGLYFMRRAKNFVNIKGMKSLYYSLVHSHLIYAIQVWSTTSQGNINSLFKLQKQAIRLIHNAKYNAHTESLFKESKILPIPKLIEFFQLQFMQHYVNGFLPSSFNDMAITREAVRNLGENENGPLRYQLRNDEELFLPHARLKTTEKAPYYSFPRIWSAFDDLDIKIQRNKKIFNAKLKDYFIQQLQSNYKCTRILCPHCHLGNVSPHNSSSENDE
jgi:hypothetical protein